MGRRIETYDPTTTGIENVAQTKEKISQRQQDEGDCCIKGKREKGKERKYNCTIPSAAAKRVSLEKIQHCLE